MVASKSSHKHHPPLDTVGRAARIGAILGGTFGAITGFVIDINQILNMGAKTVEGLFGVPPAMFFVGAMLGYALGASVGVCLQTLAGCCASAAEPAEQKKSTGVVASATT